MHLYRYMLKATNKALAQVLQVVIAHYQIDFSIKAVEHLGVGGEERMIRIEIEVHCYKSFKMITLHPYSMGKGEMLHEKWRKMCFFCNISQIFAIFARKRE